MNRKPSEKHTAMKKRIVSIIMALFMVMGTATAQVFIMEDDDALNQRDPRGDIIFNVMVNSQDTNTDQYVPIGEGLLLLSGMAGAYLLRRRKNE